MGASIALVAIEFALDLTEWEWTDPVLDGFWAGVSFGTMVGYSALTCFVAAGRKWARTTSVMLIALSNALVVYFSWRYPPEDAYAWATSIGYMLLDAAIVWLLLASASRNWFSGVRAQRRAF